MRRAIFAFLVLTCAQVCPADSKSDFAAAIQAGERLPRLHSLLVSQHGNLLIEHYFHGTRAADYANIKSASKSVISALVGIAIERKLIAGVRTPIATWFPELNAPGIDPRKRKITIEDLLTMRSGLVETNRGYGPWVRSPNWVRYLLTRPMQFDPGDEMNYNTGNTHLLSAVITKVSGTSTWDFLQKSVGAPLGMSIPRWQQDPQGIYFGGNNMVMTPQQMLRFGELYLHRGAYQGKQIVPAKWVDDSFVPRTQSPISGELYGYGWWMRQLAGYDVQFAWGFGGQYIFIVPSLDMVIVTTSSDAVSLAANDKQLRRDYRGDLFDLLENQVIPAAAKTLCASTGGHAC